MSVVLCRRSRSHPSSAVIFVVVDSWLTGGLLTEVLSRFQSYGLQVTIVHFPI